MPSAGNAARDVARKVARKMALRDELFAKLRVELETLERAHRGTVEGATHAEAKPENDKDTRAIEASYLARGQAARVEDLRAGLASVKDLHVQSAFARVALGALVVVEEDEKEETLFLAPAGGGARLEDGAVRVITPEAPLAKALLAKPAGDEVEVVIAGRKRALAIVEVI